VRPDKSRLDNQLLDPYHTHFILVDDAKHKYGGETKFRARLERRLIEREKIPIVVLVIGGGPDTADSVLEAIKKSMPCVFIDGSGQLANVFSLAIKIIEDIIERKKKDKSKKKIVNDDSGNNLDSKSREEIRAKLRIEFPGKNVNDINAILEKVENALNSASLHLLSVCRPINGNVNIDIAILLALLKAQKQITENVDGNAVASKFLLEKAQLRLALEWDRIDIAKKYIFDNSSELKDKVLNF
jgi:hypothetical protein